MKDTPPSTIVCWAIGSVTALLAAAKLTGFLSWSWWWALSPLWLFAAFIFICLVLVNLAYDPNEPERHDYFT